MAGADGKLVLCYNGTVLVTTAFLLRDTGVWTAERETHMDTWVREVLRDAAGIKGKGNNWASWGIFAALSADAWLGDSTAMTQDAERLRNIIDEQIEHDGSMPHEIKRGKSGIWYTYFALAPMTAACQVLRHNGGADLFDYQPPSGGNIRDAIAFFYDHGVADQSSWPRSGVSDAASPSGRNGALLYPMGIIYDQTTWRDHAEHPIWRGHSGLAWMTPSLVPPLPRP